MVAMSDLRPDPYQVICQIYAHVLLIFEAHLHWLAIGMLTTNRLLSTAITRPLFIMPQTAWKLRQSIVDASNPEESYKKRFRGGSRVFSTTHSQRGVDAVSLLPTYLADAREVQRYSPETPHGALQLGVAENQMLEDLLVPALSQFGSFSADCIYYQPTHGRPSFRTAFCEYLKRALRLSRDLDPEGLVVGAGCNAVLENLCITLAEPGEGVLIPTPYYAAFEFDLVARAGLSILPVNTMKRSGVPIPDEGGPATVPVEAYYPTRGALDAALEAAQEDGERPRILLLSHPHNPLGVCYPPEVIRECIDWARENRIHLVSDEIYAGSVYRKPEVFTSALDIAGELGPYVHFVYALSKDFALSGLRVGACYSENMDIRVPMQKLNDLCQISSETQVLVENMMTSKSDDGKFWTDSFLDENCSRIRSRGDQLQSLLGEFQIPFLPGDAGLFLWIDMSRFLPPLDPAAVGANDVESMESMQERERTLYLELMNDYGLLLTPGLSMRNERPGFFRCVFTAASDHEFEVGLQRLRKVAQDKS